LLESALAALPPGKVKILKLVVSAGVLSGVEKECLSMYLAELGRNTPAAGAELELRIAPAKLVCNSCGSSTDYDPTGPVLVLCSLCGKPNSLQGGQDEIVLESLEVSIND
jgi:hydrogenase nickel incorporation protein HypA/HybF